MVDQAQIMFCIKAEHSGFIYRILNKFCCIPLYILPHGIEKIKHKI